MEKVLTKMRDIEKNNVSAEELAMEIIDQILNSTSLTDSEQYEIIRQLELQTLTMMDNLYQGEEDSEMEMANDLKNDLSDDNLKKSGDQLGAHSEEIFHTEQRLYDFHRTLERVKSQFKDLKKKQLTKQETG